MLTNIFVKTSQKITLLIRCDVQNLQKHFYIDLKRRTIAIWKCGGKQVAPEFILGI